MIEELRIDSLEALRECLEGNLGNARHLVYRGHADARWKLESTLHRLIEGARRTGAKQGSIGRFVEMHVERFKLEIRGRRGDNPSKLTGDDLWALGQHYGLATPLLDWSRSPYIALFFALERINFEEEDRALWCLDKTRVEIENRELEERNQLRFIVPDTDDNKRLLGQSGLFSKGPVMSSVDDWVRRHLGSTTYPVLRKLVLPGDHAFRKRCLRTLELMNLNHSTIFPDLIGASRYCNVIAEDYET